LILNSLPRSCLFLTIAILSIGASPAISQQPKVTDEEFPGNLFVKARMIADTDALAPGTPSHVAVIFDISNGWHLYWRNPGDSGLPPTVKFKAPPGVEIGPARWPAPVKRIEGDMLVNYVHEGRLMLVFPITVGKSFSDKDIQLHADVDWLVCKEKCVSGKGSLELTLPVSISTKPSKEVGLFRNAEPLFPVPSSGESSPFKGLWEGDNLVVQAPGAARIAFFPYINEEDVYPEDMIHGGKADGKTLRLPYGANVAKIPSVSGVLAITRDGRETFHEFMIPTQKMSPSKRSTVRP
jgi:DsbC/DsbD-like thiol-disulfide interchange protein